ncbi:MAG: radical SAM protein [Candidatus Thermoplasmatota archaeon]|nr:radical SAM protein [Candidatus Thermoplasmatota archaeon]
MMLELFTKRIVREGVHHFQGKGKLEGKRIHLRVDSKDRGILIIDASRMLILNRTGLEFTYLILEGLDDQSIVKRIRRVYRVKKEEVLQDLKLFREEFDAAVASEEIISDMEDDLSRLYEGQKAPYRMDLALTYRCSNDCMHCYNETKDKKELSTDQWKKVLEKLWDLGIPHIVFTGGEPTLLEDLPELIAYAEDLGQITGLNTNGRKLKDKKYLKRLMDAGLDHVQITLASHDEEVHERITRGKGSHRETVQAIRNCLEAVIYLVTNTTIMEENRDGVLDTISFLRDLGVKHIAVNSLIRSGKGKSARGLEPADLGTILEKGRDMGRLSGFEFRWYSPTPYCILNPMSLGLGIRQCSACRLNMAVEPDGAVIPCQSYYEPLGNILRDRWKDIWEHELCRKVRERGELPRGCKGCDLLEVCGGGCPLSWKSGEYTCMNVLSS